MIYTPDKRIRALSWKEPFASLMLHGKIETRTWATGYRGWVLICASKAPYGGQVLKSICGERQMGRAKEALHSSLRHQNDYPYGKAIAIGYLANCRMMAPSDADMCFVNYRDDLYCHIYKDVQAIEPFDWKGSQGWRTLGDEDKKKIKLVKQETEIDRWAKNGAFGDKPRPRQ